jgi:CheY-like chemotaxis protein
MRTMLHVGLQFHGFTIWLARDGAEALEFYRSHQQHIALVLLDVCMPNLDGPQTLDQLRQLHPGVRCWFMTGNSGGYTIGELLERGAERVLAKPFSLVELAHQVSELLAGATVSST